MADQEMGPEQLTAKSLPGARRGYERRAVERLLEETQRAWAALQEEHRRLLAEVDRAGGLDYLARDLGAVGGDVGRLLADAQEAARGLRERAKADSADRLAAAETEAHRLVAEAEAEARRLLAETEEQTFHLRGDAWAAGMELLRQAAETGRGMLREANVDVLSVRAAAEQEAHRLVAGARRESQDLLREARFAAERAALEARAAAEYQPPATMAPPEPPPESRSEPEATGRRRRHAPQTPVQAQDVIRVIQPPEGQRPAARPSIDPGSYGDALAAEVEALWESGEVQALPPSPEPAPPARPAARAPEVKPAEAEQVAAPPEPELAEPAASAPVPGPRTKRQAVGRARKDSVVERVPEEPASGSAAETGAVAEGTPSAEALSPPAGEAPIPEAAPGLVEDLFSRLRSTHRSTGGGRRRGRGGPPPGETLPGLGPVAATIATARGPVPDAVELRERLVLPVQNSALRRVKESLVELQNSALDSLRVSGAWEAAGPALAALAPALDPVAEEGAEAGAQAAAAFLGGEPPAPVITTRSGALVQAMADELGAQVAAALAETSDAGPLEVSSAVSRVFRAWRAEEAEHWVRTVAYAAYHDSLLAGLAVGGVRTVAPVAHGLLCPECPAFRGLAWDPAGEPPPGTARPPAHSDCVCTVVPSA